MVISTASNSFLKDDNLKYFVRSKEMGCNFLYDQQ